MPHLEYNTFAEQKSLSVGANGSGARQVLDIPKQYQARIITLLATFDLIVANAADTIKPGGLFNFVNRMELLRSGGNQIYNASGVNMAAWCGAVRGVNPAEFITIYDTANQVFLTNAQKEVIPVGTYKVSISYNIDFSNFGGIRPNDTLYNLNTIGDTFQMVVQRKADNNVFGNSANITITNPYVELRLNQIRSIRKDELLIPVIGQFNRGENNDDLKVARTERIVKLPAGTAYRGFMLSIIDPTTGNPDTSFFDNFSNVRTRIGVDVYLELRPLHYRNEFTALFGEFVNWKWADRFMPVIFNRQLNKTADRLSDTWLTANSEDIQLVFNHKQVDDKNLSIFYEQFYPYTDNWSEQLINSPRN